METAYISTLKLRMLRIWASGANDGVEFVSGNMIDSPAGAIHPAGADFIPQGHVSRAGSTPQSYSVWGSSEESTTESEDNYRKYFGQSLCRVLAGCAVILVLLAVLGIVGIAVYLGYFSTKEAINVPPANTYIGTLRVYQGDSWVQDLTFPDSPAFRAKAAKYKNMLKNVYEKSVLGQSFENVEITEFEKAENKGFRITFRMNLDRRKIPFWHLNDVEKVLEKILEQELTSSSPIAFSKIKVDTSDLHIQKLIPTRDSFAFTTQASNNQEEKERDLVTVKVPGAILRVKSSDVSNVNGKEIEQIIAEKVESTIRPSITTIQTTVVQPGFWNPVYPSRTPESSTSTANIVHKLPTNKESTYKEILPSISVDKTNLKSDYDIRPNYDFIPDYDVRPDFDVSPDYHIRPDHYLRPEQNARPDYDRRHYYDVRPAIGDVQMPFDSGQNPVNGEDYSPTTSPFNIKAESSSDYNFPHASTKVTAVPMILTTAIVTNEVLDTSIKFSDKNLNSQPTTERSISSELYNRIGLSPLYNMLAQNAETKNDKEMNPSKQDIRSIIEHLLFIAAIKPIDQLNETNYVSDIPNQNVEGKTDLIHKPESVEEYFRETTKASKLDVEMETSELPDVKSYSGVRNFKRPISSANGLLPLDRFRYQAQASKSSISTSTSTRTPYNIWNIMTTEKPLILDTEVVTSTSFEVRYGSTTEPMPVYIHSSTKHAEIDESFSGGSFSEVEIPVITGQEVRYIRVNRTRSNYPNVVIVNLPSDIENDTVSTVLINASDPLKDRARAIRFNSKLLDISKVLKLSDSNKEKNSKQTSTDKFFQRQGKPVYSEDHITENQDQNMSLLWIILSNISKLYLSDPAILKQLYKLQEFSDISNSTEYTLNPIELEFLESLRSSIYLNSSNENIIKNNPSYKPSKKSGKSLKVQPLTTLFVTRGGNGRKSKIISVSGRSPAISGGTGTKNSPIHTFTLKEDQSLDDLLAEIFDVISKDDDPQYNPQFSHHTVDSDPSEKTYASVPVGEDSLKVMEALSKLLTDYYESYNFVFEGDVPNEPGHIVNDTVLTTEAEMITTPITLLVSLDSINVTEPTTKIADFVTATKDKKNTTQFTYSNYVHDLFPVMTRPFNPIRVTTPKIVTTLSASSDDISLEDDLSDSTYLVTKAPGESISHLPSGADTSYDVSYSVHNGTSNITFTNMLANGSQDCTEEHFRCLRGNCVPMLARCNMVRDCPDNSDEENCTCSDILKSQHYTRKICDGIIDCWDKSDETNCEWCAPGHFICTGIQLCVQPQKVCDGFLDCPNGDDERDCVKIAPNEIAAKSMNYYDEGFLMVRRHGIWGKLCFDNFENTVAMAQVSWSVADLGEAVCKTLSFESFDQVQRLYDSSPPIFRSNAPYFEIEITHNNTPLSRPRSFKRSISDLLLEESLEEEDGDGSYSLFLKSLTHDLLEPFSNSALQSSGQDHRQKRGFEDNELFLRFQETQCPNRDVVKLKCQDLMCGVRPRATTQQARIVGGSNSSPGAWPWHAALYKEGEYQCGATLISPEWLISAGHCFYSARSDFWVARLGALRRGTKFPSPFEQVRPLSHIFIHPDYVNQGFINDISLLRLIQPVTLNDFVRPVCLPPPGADVNDGQRCTLVGWGQLFEVKKVFPDTLQEVEVPLISTQECQKRTIFLPLYRITDDMFCAGYDRGGRDACLGDSGGPLMCQKLDGRWEIVGVTSNGYGCARPHRPGVYTKVVNYIAWINQVMELSRSNLLVPINNECYGHRCPLGQCIPNSGICNGRVECSDGSDEKNCFVK